MQNCFQRNFQDPEWKLEYAMTGLDGTFCDFPWITVLSANFAALSLDDLIIFPPKVGRLSLSLLETKVVCEEKFTVTCNATVIQALATHRVLRS
jgi:hypothetical protein